MSNCFGNRFREMCNCSKTNECLTVMIVCSGSRRNCLGYYAVISNTLGKCTTIYEECRKQIGEC